MRFTTRPELSGSYGMVASTHWLASAAGMAVLEQGGNAFDAAVAAGLTLQVVEPHLNGPGGDAPILLWSADRGEPIVVCGQGPAPAAATIPRYRELGLELVPGTGLLAACVPGAFDAWLLVLRDFGTLPLADVMRFPIHYAERGFPMLERIAETIAGVEGLFRAEWRSSAELWLDGDRAPRPGGMWRNPALAATYRRIVAESDAAGGDRETRIQAGRDAFLRGFVAEAIAAFCASTEVMDSTGRRHRGLLTGDDMTSFEATFEEPVTLEHRGLTVAKCGPWSQGPVMLQTLRLLEGFDVDAMGHLTGEYVHTVVECMKLAFADREAWYGDPAFTDVPLETLLSAAYADERRTLVGDAASFELRPGSPDGREPVLAHVPAVEEVAPGFGVGEPTVPREDRAVAGDTCHVDVADRFGNLVSATPSGGWLHSSPAIPGLGLCLGTRAQMFWLEEGLPNSLEPRKRPRTTLTPSLGVRDGEGALAWGTPGGDGQDQWSLQFLLSHLGFGLNLQEAIDAPAFTSTHFPSSFYPRTAEPGHLLIEARAGAAAIDELRARGHDLEVGEPWSIGRLSAASRAPDGTLRAAANPRGMQGYAAGR
ncbi:MAG: gamma-glutamyltranspeptidase / glutathione hydrolase [Solirubrobacteraceae bacterium]|jgi:gamma-glutamyltranspeptidase/glutathione hydrolase|nr:gamma-glutamyltranspeptidase / glutathione hydrolase [Solirubrobacteraceae bacterium]